MPLIADTWAALAASIAHRLHSREIDATAASELSAAIEPVLLAEGERNERRIAALRVMLALLFLALAAVTWFRFRLVDSGGAGVAGLSAAGWCVASIALLVALRRGWYRLWLRQTMPALDALAIGFGGIIASSRSVHRAEIVGTVAVLCAALTLSGALRLTKSATYFATMLGVGTFAIVALLQNLDPFAILGIAGTIGGMGTLAADVSDLVRKVVAGEVNRVTFERRLEQANAEVTIREDVLKVVAHDLRNPLGSIMMSADLLLETDLSDARRSRTLTLMKRAAERMNRLIQDLLTVAKMEGGTVELDLAVLDPIALLTETVELMQPLAAERSLTLLMDAEPGLPPVSGDAPRLLQVFSNLIGNAIKFTPAGGRITLGARHTGWQVWFSVGDTGPGIPPDQLERVFERFWQARKTDKRGIGLGLAIAKGIVEAHGGKLRVESAVGVGTKFFFPLLQNDSAHTESRSDSRKRTASP